MTADVARETRCLTNNIEQQIEQRRAGKRKKVRHGGLLCCGCLSAPPAAPDRYCHDCRAARSRADRRAARAELLRLRQLEQGAS
jgi:hypothetical protein